MKMRFRPKIDRLFAFIFIPVLVILLGVTVTVGIFEPASLLYFIPIGLFVLYFLISPLFGFVELSENELFIKYGFFLKKSIPYEKIRSLEKSRSFYSTSMMSLKCAFEHIDVKYNTFDVTTVSVADNDEFIEKMQKIIESTRA